MPKKSVLIPLPAYGFDPTESAVPWQRLTELGHPITFATPGGQPASADVRMATGQDLPLLLRGSLMAQASAVEAYRAMERSEAFRRPLAYAAIRPEAFDALLLPGGHDKGMRVYLEDPSLQAAVAVFFEGSKPVGAICHGTLLAARSRSSATGKSVLWGRKTTGLTRRQELIAWWLTRWKLGDYYRTYEVPMADELISNLRDPGDYSAGPGWPIPLRRDSYEYPQAGYTVRDGLYLSARWPGDAHRFALEFATLLER